MRVIGSVILIVNLCGNTTAAKSYSDIKISELLKRNRSEVENSKTLAEKLNAIERFRALISKNLTGPPTDRNPNALENYYHLVSIDTYLEFVPKKKNSTTCESKKKSFKEASGEASGEAAVPTGSGKPMEMPISITHVAFLIEQVCGN